MGGDVAMVRIATRASPLAVWQAEFVGARLREARRGLRVEVRKMVAAGDRVAGSLAGQGGGKGWFLKELEEALLRGEADLAVHSMKDVPIGLPAGLRMAAVLGREDARDGVVFREEGGGGLRELAAGGGRVGTGSLRRGCQLRAGFAGVSVVDVRGNVNTRLEKLAGGEFDAVVLAVAGLKRLGLEGRIGEYLPAEVCLPAAGQGALGIECREDDAAMVELAGLVHDAEAGVCVAAERAVNARLNGGCAAPVAAYAVVEGGGIWVRGLVGEVEGGRLIRGERRGERRGEATLEGGEAEAEAEEVGRGVAEDLLRQGAGEMLGGVGR